MILSFDLEITRLEGASLFPGGFIESGLSIDYGVMMFVSFLPWVMMRKSIRFPG